MRKKDYSEYTLTEAQRYQLRHRGDRSVVFDYFNNRVSFDPERRTFHIRVDDGKEDDWMDDFVEEYESAEAARSGLEFRGPEEDDEATRQAEWAQNQEDAAWFARHYHILCALMDDSLRNQEGKRKEPVPVNNVLSGADVVMRYGEGILDFVYADFKAPASEVMGYLRAWNGLRREYQETNPTPLENAEPEKVYNHTQEIVENYYRYQDTLPFTKKIMMQSLYTMICPPVFTDELEYSRAVRSYCAYLNDLQREYLELLEFCFDETFYPDLLGNRHPAERFYLYRELHDLPTFMDRTEAVLLSSRRRTGQVMPYGMTTEEVIQRLSSQVPITEELREFAERYHVEAEELSAALTLPHYFQIGYDFGSVDQILELEFTKLLESDVRFRKCQRCGRYFILKGNYDTRYCGRVAEGETRSCQELAAQENYKKKAADRPALAVYDRYYRRYAARKKVRQIKEADFKKWRYEAMCLRDDCEDGKITVEEYRRWMEGYFPNRKKAESSAGQ